MDRKQFLILTIISFLVVTAWITTDIYHQRAGVRVEPSLQEALESLDPTFDQPVLKTVSQIGP